MNLFPINHVTTNSIWPTIHTHTKTFKEEVWALIPSKTKKLYGHMNSAMTRTQMIEKKKSEVFLGEMMIFFLLIVSRGKSNEENKLKIVTSLRFYG